MSELTREMIRQHCLVLRDALGNLFPSIDDPSREYYWELLDELGKAALSALIARSEGFREGDDPVLKAMLIGPDERFEIALNVKHPKCHAAADAFWNYWKANGETHKHGYYESTWSAINAALRLVGVKTHNYPNSALSPRETDADPQEPSGKSPGPAGNSGHKQNSPRGEPVRDVPAASAPSGEVAEMVRRLRYIAETDDARFGGISPALVKAIEVIESLGKVESLYYELIYEVANKYPGETRHQTALRYIKRAEEPGNGTSQVSNTPPPPERP